MEASEIIIGARGKLVAGHPFFAWLILSLDLVEDRRCHTGWTDGKTLAYSPDWVGDLLPEMVVGFLAHEVMHLALLHHLRRGKRDPLLWNLAGDLVINAILQEEGFLLPTGRDDYSDFLGLTTEEVYDLLSLKKEGDSPPFPAGEDDEEGGEEEESESGREEDSGDDDQGGGGGGEQGEEDEPGEKSGGGKDENCEEGNEPRRGGEKAPHTDRLREAARDFLRRGARDFEFGREDPGRCGEVRDLPRDEAGEPDRQDADTVWSDAVRRAAAQGDLPLGIRRALRRIYEPQLDWKALLSRFLTLEVQADYSWKSPNRRYITAGVYLPSLTLEENGRMAVIVDTSGSIGSDDLDRLFSECRGVATVEKVRVILAWGDCRIDGWMEIDRWTRPELSLSGGGGTSYVPGFEWVEKKEILPRCLVYLTDGICNRFPPREPDYPVIWVVGGENANRGFKPPWGEVVWMR